MRKLVGSRSDLNRVLGPAAVIIVANWLSGCGPAARPLAVGTHAPSLSPAMPVTTPEPEATQAAQITIAAPSPSGRPSAARTSSGPVPTPMLEWGTSPSPDGVWLARFGSTDDPEPPWPSTEFNEWSYRALSILSTKGKKPIVVLDAWLPNEWKCVPGVDFLGWSPDSRHAFAASYWPCAGGCASPVGVTDRVMRIDVASGDVEEIRRVRFRYSIDVCTGKPVHNGWLR